MDLYPHHTDLNSGVKVKYLKLWIQYPYFLESQHIAYSRNGHSYEHFNFPNPVWFKLFSLCLEVQLKARSRMAID